jgi:hypothetical protein
LCWSSYWSSLCNPCRLLLLEIMPLPSQSNTPICLRLGLAANSSKKNPDRHSSAACIDGNQRCYQSPLRRPQTRARHTDDK